MNENLKNILSFIKEVLELKNKNIYSVDNYEIHIDFGQFYNQFKELVDTPNYLNLNINSDGVIFKIQYIKEENKKEIPKIPNDLKDYISIKNDNDIIPLEDDLEKSLREEKESRVKFDSDEKMDELLKEAVSDTIEVPEVREIERETVPRRNERTEKLEPLDKPRNKTPMEKVEEDTLENDLFDLIDWMYENKEEE